MTVGGVVIALFVAGLALGFGLIGYGFYLVVRDLRRFRGAGRTTPIIAPDPEDDSFTLAELHITGGG